MNFMKFPKGSVSDVAGARPHAAYLGAYLGALSARAPGHGAGTVPTVPISSLRRGPGTLGLKSRLSAGLTLGFPERDTSDDRMPRDCPGSKAALAFRGDLGF